MKRLIAAGMVAALGKPEVKKRFAELDMDPVGDAPAQAARFVESEMQRWAALVKAANIKPD